jgi:Holliday junction DNA helicase RuvA
MNIVSGNDKALTAAPGVGKKIAQRIILELKDKMAKDTESISFRDSGFTPAADMGGSKLSDASAALTVLGYGPTEVNAALKHIDVENLSLEEIIKAALKQMIK